MANDTRPGTPRRMTVIVELDITEGPRMRRGVTPAQLDKEVGFVARNAVVAAVGDSFGLPTDLARSRVIWHYPWDDVTGETNYRPT